MSDELKIKLQQIEITPPPGVWDTIAATLKDDMAYHKMADRLNNYEPAPPAHLLQNILNNLNQPAEAPVVPIAPVQQERKSTFFSYKMLAAASIIAILILIPAIRYITRNDSTNKTSIASNTDNNTILPSIPKANNTAGTEPVTKETSPHVVLPAKPSIEINLVRTKEHKDNTKMVSPTPHVAARNNISLADNTPMPNHYFIVHNPEGQQRKVSSKFIRAAYILNGDSDNTKRNIPQWQHVQWKNKLDNWSNKILRYGLAPTASNGMDILRLQELIQKEDY